MWKLSLETRMKMSKARLGKLNPKWVGDDVSYNALHHWVRRHLPEPELCQKCNLVKPYDLANVTGNYTRDFENWQYLCRKCHMTTDNRLKRWMKGKKVYDEKRRAEILKRRCNLCHEGHIHWYRDIDGWLCKKCYNIIKHYGSLYIHLGNEDEL